MKQNRFIITLIAILLTISGAMAKPKQISSSFDVSDLSTLPAVSYVQIGKSLIRNSSILLEMNIDPKLCKSISQIQMVISSLESAPTVRTRIAEISKSMKQELYIMSNGSRNNIVVWVEPSGKNDEIFNKVIIGIGSASGLTYILLEGEMPADVMSQLVNSVSF